MFLAPLAVAVLAAGCGTVADNDAVARVDDDELSTGDLTELVVALGQGEPTEGAAARDAITLWLRVAAVNRGLDDAGITLTDGEIDEATTQMSSVVPNFGELSDRTRDYLVQAQAAFLAIEDIPPPADDERRVFYERGPERSGIACTKHVLVESEADARDVLAELDAGADFATLAAERSADPGSAAVGGALGCTATSQFQATFVPEFVDAALRAAIGVPTEPVESEFGFHVIVVQQYDEVADQLTGFFASQDYLIARALEDADVYVDPRYGAVQDGIVVALS